MSSPGDQVLFESDAYRLTASKLAQADLTAVLEGTNKLIITRNGETREVNIPAMVF